MKRSLSVWVISLGCPKNRVDTEKLLGSLGIPVNFARSPGRADLIFINTCAFIESATRESLQEIFQIAARIKSLKRKPLLAVAGCLPGRYGIETLAREIPEVDLWLDSASMAKWPAMLCQKMRLPAPGAQARICVNKSYAWLKIAEGCQQKCAFCVIPSIRGPLRSQSAESILAEARKLVATGIRELDLVAQDLTSWGRDLALSGKGPRDLADLVSEIASLPGLEWLRLMYLYPAAINDKLLSTIAQGLPVLPYLDLPLQHSQTGILEAMGRPFRVNPRELLAKIRSILPGAALRATLMVGFPGETEQDFENLCDFVEEAQFQHLGVFAFMPEEGSRAAEFPNQVPEQLREERRSRLMEIQANISANLLAERVGTRMDVLVDEERSEEWPGLYSGRVWFQAPEVDGLTWISGEGVKCGGMINAEIVDSQVYDLSALAWIA